MDSQRATSSTIASEYAQLECGRDSIRHNGHHESPAVSVHSRSTKEWTNVAPSELGSYLHRGKTRIERFWEKVDKTGSCWLWTAAQDHGYGVCARWGSVGGIRAHAVSWALANGRWPRPGEVVRHTCDTPRCVNPSHLLIGTQADNLRDMTERGRRAIGERAGHGKLSSHDVLEIHRLNSQGVPQKEIGARFGIHVEHVSKIVRGALWRHMHPTLKAVAP